MGLLEKLVDVLECAVLGSDVLVVRDVVAGERKDQEMREMVGEESRAAGGSAARPSETQKFGSDGANSYPMST